MLMMRVYRHEDKFGHAVEECYYIAHERALTPQEFEKLLWVLTDHGYVLKLGTTLRDPTIIEVGPRLSVETAFSSNAVSIFSGMNLPIKRVERSKRYALTGVPYAESRFDKMTEDIYKKPLSTFETGITPDPVRTIDVTSKDAFADGHADLLAANKTLGLGMDQDDLMYNTTLFAHKLRRNPTDAELFQIGNGNSEHSRHWFFRGIQVIDGIEMPDSLMDIVKEPWVRNPNNSLVAFTDNAGVMKGCEVDVFLPTNPSEVSGFTVRRLMQHITATAETHNHPTLIAPFPGAETGAGGRIRDNRAVGRGGLVHAGFAGYCVGNLHLNNYDIYRIPGEDGDRVDASNGASARDILIQGSNGVSDYGNKIGEPDIGGFVRSGSFGGREFRKPVLYSAGVGRVLDMHFQKRQPEVGMLIVRIGGPAYKIGVGGGSASSMVHGAQDAGLDYKSVQRGNAEMENRANRVIQACAEMCEKNPIESIHDQGAGGPSNVLTELMEPLGGRIDIRKINVGDATMSVLEIWVAEFQEGYGLLVRPENIDLFKSICNRERVACEVLGEITGDGNVVVYDSADNTTPVNLSLEDILGKLPRKRFASERKSVTRDPLVIPKGLTIEHAFENISKLPQDGSKNYLVHKVDRSVTGLVVRQQCCGPLQVPVSDVAVTADGFFGHTGVAVAFGEQPIKMLLSSAAGTRMTVSEMLTNICPGAISKLEDIKCRGNWMWPAKQPHEGARLFDAAVPLSQMMIALGIALDGGKDSLSMATTVGDKLVLSPGQLVIMGYAPVPDITKVVTPELRGGVIAMFDIGFGKNRLGGSSFAQTLSQIGDDPPDIDDVDLLRRAFVAMQELIQNRLVTAYHDRSGGGLLMTLAEMCIAGNRGAHIQISEADPQAFLFNEEAGMVFEYDQQNAPRVDEIVRKYGLENCRYVLGSSIEESGVLKITHFIEETLFNKSLVEIRVGWESTSTELEKYQSNLKTVEAERQSHHDRRVLEYRLSFVPTAPSIVRDRAPKVAILREEGTNGDREMAAACYTANMEPHTVSMKDLFSQKVEFFDQYRGLIFPGGFSFADAFGSAKGWAAIVRFNPLLRDMFDRFYERQDTLSLGVCNGFQWMTQFGLLPYRGIPDKSQPRLVRNKSERFESRWVVGQINPSPAVAFREMEGSVLGMWIAHGEGRPMFPDVDIYRQIMNMHLTPLTYVDPNGFATETYPYNPNGAPDGIAAICSLDGRHLGMMPHPERSFLKWQWPWMPEHFRSLEASPWLRMFENMRTWCLEN